MKCDTCGGNIAAGAKFCGQCGKEAKPIAQMRPVTGASKECPKCRTTVEASKGICPQCGFRWGVSDAPAARASPGATIGCLAAAALIIGALYSCMRSSPEGIAAEEAETAAGATKSAEERQKGFHCLSPWDGSNRSFVSKVKDQLRDPDSFAHDETKITPRDVKGQHMLTMRYRARNGFGGMNVATAMGIVDGQTCEASVITSGE